MIERLRDVPDDAIIGVYYKGECEHFGKLFKKTDKEDADYGVDYCFDLYNF